MKVPAVYIISIGIFSAIARACLELLDRSKQKDEAILVTMSLINCVALGFVIVVLLSDLRRSCAQRIQKAGLLSGEKKNLIFWMKVILAIPIVIYILCGSLYMYIWKSTCVNDIMSVIALSISIANDKLADELGVSVYMAAKRINKLRTR